MGIDLGTTNCAVAYVDLRDEDQKRKIEIFTIPQLTNESEIRRLPMLPSFLYIPGEYDISEKAIILPWGTRSDNFVGVFAREQGAKVPSRLVSSAKSWLCNPRVDRKARILPWGEEKGFTKVSPVTASASYLEHIRKAWNTYHEEEDLFLENQKVIITVPASFDEIARDLTIESASAAGLKDIIVLEEPLAAFYSWLIRHEKDWDAHVKPDELILVCDVGGGTTDFTLIALKSMSGRPGFERIAVGDHLILGGDNMDIALAGKIESRSSGLKGKLSLDRWKALVSQCRKAKEEILNDETESRRITLVGRGNQLISDTISAVLKKEDIEDTVLNSFFPLLTRSDLESDADGNLYSRFNSDIAEKQSGLGLPFEKDSAITRHLALFLKRHQEDVRRVLNRENFLPDLILFNGGALKPGSIQDRIVGSIDSGFGIVEGRKPGVLENTDFDLAVARGAAYYGLVTIGEGVRVGSGSPRAYYLGVVEQIPATDSGKKQALCLIERGMEEGARISLKERKFDVLANQPVVFELYSSSYRSGDKSGDLVEIDDSLTLLPGLYTVIQYGKAGSRTTIPVHLEAKYSEVGALELKCRSQISPHSWRLQFDLRNLSPEMKIKDETIFEASMIQEVCNSIIAAFAPDSTKSALDALVRNLTGQIGENKELWPLGLIRAMADQLLDIVNARKLGPEHEARWLNLIGFCLRPGFGDGFDEHRVKKLWKIYSEGPIRENNTRVRLEWWILWRRVAGGLTAAQQKQFIQDTGRLIAPKKGVIKKISEQEKLETWMALAGMERMETDQKVRWGEILLSEFRPNKVKPQQLWALSRLGGRELLYGSTDRVVPVSDVVQWIRTLMSWEWTHQKPVVQAVIQMARKTGDRLRDIGEENLMEIKQWLLTLPGEHENIESLEAAIPFQPDEKNLIFGESLPLGLVLTNEK